ncbi:predicted protein [Nematostella vectensis]|uniref:AI-2E family transporter n=1 Tax=Nematostella vectensis TaxID=45351 RepID=A7T9V7_NEMVE|nr:predicted protein [Nematostella vectensis]|eukprot:XP_001619316.1 hypothetical protein NEMVEDRAFT_v1g224305 [Nematostella vectensis]
MLGVFLLVLMPLLWRQVITLFNELPRMLGEWQSLFLLLPERYPTLITNEQVLQLIEAVRGEAGSVGQSALSFSLSSLPMLVSIMIYVVLVPILVFFFLKDRELIGVWFRGYLPRERALITQVAEEMNKQIANYIRGKVIEIIICGVVTYIAFAALGLNYAALLALFVGLSVVVPYIGAVVVTVPVALIGLFQWGFGDQFIYLMRWQARLQARQGIPAAGYLQHQCAVFAMPAKAGADYGATVLVAGAAEHVGQLHGVGAKGADKQELFAN